MLRYLSEQLTIIHALKINARVFRKFFEILLSFCNIRLTSAFSDTETYVC